MLGVQNWSTKLPAISSLISLLEALNPKRVQFYQNRPSVLTKPDSVQNALISITTGSVCCSANPLQPRSKSRKRLKARYCFLVKWEESKPQSKTSP